MFMESNAEITAVLGWIRDLSILGALLTIGWKARDLVQPAVDFFKDFKNFLCETRTFMSTTSQALIRIETNHLAHVEKALVKMSGVEIESSDANAVQE